MELFFVTTLLTTYFTMRGAHGHSLHVEFFFTDAPQETLSLSALRGRYHGTHPKIIVAQVVPVVVLQEPSDCI